MALFLQAMAEHEGYFSAIADSIPVGYYLWLLAPESDVTDDLHLGLSLMRMKAEPDAENEFDVTVDNSWIDVSRIRDLVKDCVDNHGGRCHTIVDPWQRIQPTTDLWFIDVERRCLTKQHTWNPTVRYVALSYVWGATNDALQTTTANFDQLCQHGSFDHGSFDHGSFDTLIKRYFISNTIAHCMLVTQELGVRYLWVDRFCILQDDVLAKPSQLAGMAAIYANSYVTVAATEGSGGEFGLPGLFVGLLRQQPFARFDFGFGLEVNSCGCRSQLNVVNGSVYTEVIPS
jgi:hypothetical protein